MLLISRKLPNSDNLFEYILIAINQEDIKIIAKYREKQLVFIFDEKARKVYIMKP
jgi:hypothetical protein